MKTVVPVLLGLFLSSLPVHASSGQEGHGGVVEACFRSVEIRNRVKRILDSNAKSSAYEEALNDAAIRNISSIRLLDFIVSGVRPIATPPGARNYQDVLDERMDVLRRTHYPLYSRVKQIHEQLLSPSSTRWKFQPTGVVRMGNPGIGRAIRANCLPLQIANQQRISDTFSIVNVDSRLFDLLDRKSPVEASAFIMHEYGIYLVSHTLPVTSPLNPALIAQQLVGMIYASELSPATSNKFVSALSDLGINIGGVHCVAAGPCYDDNDTIHSKDSFDFLGRPVASGTSIRGPVIPIDGEQVISQVRLDAFSPGSQSFAIARAALGQELHLSGDGPTLVMVMTPETRFPIVRTANGETKIDFKGEISSNAVLGPFIWQGGTSCHYLKNGKSVRLVYRNYEYLSYRAGYWLDYERETGKPDTFHCKLGEFNNIEDITIIQKNN